MKAMIIGPMGIRRLPSGPVMSASVQPSAATHCLPSTPYQTAPTSQPATAAAITAIKLIGGMIVPSLKADPSRTDANLFDSHAPGSLAVCPSLNQRITILPSGAPALGLFEGRPLAHSGGVGA